MQKFQIDRGETMSYLQQLHQDHLLVLQNSIESILIAHPLSNIPTPFIVSTNKGKNYFAACAWDAIALHFMVKQPILIKSYCYHCGNPLEVHLHDEKIVIKIPSEVLIHISKRIKFWWDNVVDTCYNHIKFYCSKEHLQDWKNEHSDRIGYTITDEQIIKLSKFLYNDKLELDYCRPSLEETKAILKSLDLTGNFWDL